MTSSTPRAYFDGMYAHNDPYGYRHRWYERRKRDLVLASLSRARFENAWEVGCSNGEVTAALAQRCTRVLATDLSPRAVELARARVIDATHVRVEQAHHPVEWPDETFDLIVFSEIGYFLSAADLETTCARLRKALREDGLLVACHWLTPFAEAPLSGADVHDVLRTQLRMPSAFHYADADFVLEGWTRGTQSVAMREGLR